eukprot:1144358-Pelagomonas_calceolata.AAC.2
MVTPRKIAEVDNSLQATYALNGHSMAGHGHGRPNLQNSARLYMLAFPERVLNLDDAHATEGQQRKIKSQGDPHRAGAGMMQP